MNALVVAPPPAKTLVVSRFNENLLWLPLVPPDWRITIANKGRDDLLVAPRPGLEIVELENRGREADTFLRVIRAARKRLAAGEISGDDLYAFFQGDPEAHCPGAPQQLAIVPHGGFRELGRTLVCDRDGRPHDPGKSIAGGYGYIFGLEPPVAFRFIVGAQFMATAAVLATIDDGVLERAHRCSVEWPHGPWIMERLWLYLVKRAEE